MWSRSAPGEARRRALAALLAAVVVAVAVAAPARAADASVVLTALDVLRDRYPDPLSEPDLLNAALGGLRQTLQGLGVQAAPADLPPGIAADQARAQFQARFDAAAAAAGRQHEQDLAFAAARAMLASLRDSHTVFLDPQQVAERRARQSGQASFSGIGITYQVVEGRIYIMDVIPGRPADAAGVRRFDRVVAVDGRPVESLSQEQFTAAVRGQPGTVVTLTVQRPGVAQLLTIGITRAPISLPTAVSRMLDRQIGYLRLYGFNDNASTEARAALQGLLDGGMRALVLDLRDNPGGFVRELDAVTNLFLPPGLPVLRTVDRSRRVAITRTAGGPFLPQSLSMAVLVNGGSGSAAELLAAALHEHGRATLVGTKTAGAVEVSILAPLPGGAAMSVTIQRVFTGRGARLEGAGVTPDQVVDLTLADLEAGRDAQFDQAAAFLLQRVARSALVAAGTL